jgi:hypothetical protein
VIPGLLGGIPSSWWSAQYDGDRYPGSEAVSLLPGVEHGANCQLFAYAVLGLFGRVAPPLRSSDLWADRQASIEVTKPCRSTWCYSTGLRMRTGRMSASGWATTQSCTCARRSDTPSSGPSLTSLHASDISM